MINPVQDILNKNNDTVKAIFEYVRDSISKIKNNGIFITNNSTLKDVYINKKGNSTDINMLLIAMLRKVHIDAFPVILSTRENGFVNNDVPLLSDYNYLVVYINDTNSHSYFLDASNAFLGFKKLPLNCYNGSVRVISEKTIGKFLTSDSLKENENSFVYISNEDDGSSTAICKETYGYYQSLKYREDIKNTPLNKVTELIQHKYPADTKINDLSIDSLKLYDNPVALNYNINYHFNDNIVYLNPMMNKAIIENPFKSTARKLPIEMPHVYQLNHSFTMEIPKGYSIDEIPKSTRILLNEDDGIFEYKISVLDNLIQLRCKLKFNKANYNSDNYQNLREFYNLVVHKMSEQIVLKKQIK